MFKPAKRSRKVSNYRTNYGRRLFVEPLEPRRLLATLLTGGKTVTYQDVDGDTVTVALSKAVLTTGNVNSVFTFSSGAGAVNGSNTTAEQLQEIDLTQLGAAATGMNITITAKPGIAGGDGFANVGFINGTGINLGTVSVHGDLGHIDAGDGTSATLGLTSLSVHSIGRAGKLTSSGSLESDIVGQLGKLTVTSDIAGAYIHVSGPGGAVLGTIGSVSIGGSLIGGSDVDSGSIQTGGNIGAVIIGQDLQGGSADDSGAIVSGGKLASVKIGDSIIGGSSREDSGIIESTGDMGAVTIGQDLQGGGGEDSGAIESSGKLASVKIGGSVIGGDFYLDAGYIFSIGAMGPVFIGRNLQGGSGEFLDGAIECGASGSGVGKLASVNIGGSVIGGSGSESGYIRSAGDMGAVSIGDDLQGGSGNGSGGIDCYENLASVKIGGSSSGSIATEFGNMGAVSIGGDLQGSSTSFSGSIFSGSAKLASVKIGGSVIGGGGDHTGFIGSFGDMGSVTIGGSLISGTVADTGGIVSYSAMGAVKIGGSIVGNNTVAAVISALGPATPKAPSDIAIAGLTVGGRVEDANIFAGYSFDGTNFNPANPDAQIGAVSVGGNWVASNLLAGAEPTGTGQFEKITAGTDNAAITSSIASITIGGQVLGTPPIVSNTDSYGFAAELVKSLTIGGTKIKLISGPDNDYFAIGTTADVALEEV